MESIICLPVLLLLSLGVAQFAHIWYCRAIVRYASFSAARAVLTAPAGEENERAAARSAAETVCAPIAFGDPAAGEDFPLPGITPPLTGSDAIPGSGAVREGNVLQIELASPDPWHRCVDVKMKVPLLIPFAGGVMGRLINQWDDGEYDGTNSNSGKIARITLREQSFILKPFASSWNTP